MKKASNWIMLGCIALFAVLLVQERLSVSVMRRLYLQSVENEANWAHAYGRILIDTNLSADQKLHKLVLVNQAEIPPISAALNSFSTFGREIPDVQTQLIEIEKVENHSEK